ncbi:MAG TPA: SOS response-associated peptidase [Pseudolabrys sp.]|nr:SOS response-associated peptidase [Pseudolabrys sp.]
MCGRYTLTSAPQNIRALFCYDEQPNFPARYNIAPTQPVAIVRIREGRREFALVRWGLLPSWVKDPKQFSLLINARGESLADKPAFRNAIRRRRCLVPADGFYEWKAAGARKQPYFIHAKSGAPLAFAGLWETWIGPNGEEFDSAAIVTTSANRALAGLHDRMPVIVPPEAFDIWLGNASAEGKDDLAAACAVITPSPDDLLESIPVSTDVNRVANDHPKLIEAIFVGGEPEPRPTPAPKVAPKPVRAKKAKPEKVKKDSGQGALF